MTMRDTDQGMALPPDLSWKEAVALVDEEMEQLPDRCRHALLLCHFGGQSPGEAARRLGWRPGAVRTRLKRGWRPLILLATVTTADSETPLPDGVVERMVRAAVAGVGRSEAADG